MQKIKFDFEATKQLIYAPNSTAPVGAPVDADGNVANDGTAIGIVLCRRNESDKYWVKQNLVVMVAGYCDIIDAQAIWGDEYSAEAIAAMSDITFCDNHELPTGGGGGGGMMVVKITYNEDDDTLSCNHTYDEISTAYPNIIFVDDLGKIGYTCSFDDVFSAKLLGTNTTGTAVTGLNMVEFIISQDNTIEFIEYSM